jgi:hypothetical protein
VGEKKALAIVEAAQTWMAEHAAAVALDSETEEPDSESPAGIEAVPDGDHAVGDPVPRASAE